MDGVFSEHLLNLLSHNQTLQISPGLFVSNKMSDIPFRRINISINKCHIIKKLDTCINRYDSTASNLCDEEHALLYKISKEKSFVGQNISSGKMFNLRKTSTVLSDENYFPTSFVRNLIDCNSFLLSS